MPSEIDGYSDKFHFCRFLQKWIFCLSKLTNRNLIIVTRKNQVEKAKASTIDALYYYGMRVIGCAHAALAFLGEHLAVNIPASYNFLPNGSALSYLEWQRRN